jgi:fibronectin-binding autotransporter adhesin
MLRTRTLSVSTFLAVVFGLTTALPTQAQTWTNAASGTFTNVTGWNFGAGPIPDNGGAGTLAFQSFGFTTGITAANDLNLTLTTLQLNMYSFSASTLSSTLGGTYSFTGAGNIQQNGSGGTTTISAPVVLGSTATGLLISGSGQSNTTINGILSSNTATGAPLTIGLVSSNPSVGVFTLGVANTFAGGVVLNAGNLAISNSDGLGHLGSTYNTLTVNGGNFSATAAVTVLNNIVLNSDLVFTGPTAAVMTQGGLFGGSISGSGGVVIRAVGTGSVQIFNGINTYMGATTLGQIQFAYAGSAPQNAGGLSLSSATGSIMNTSAINVADGAQFLINKNSGDSVNNFRVLGGTGGTPINVTSGIVQVIGSTGFTTQNFGPVTGNGGATTIIAQEQAATTSQTAVYIPNLIRNGRGTFVFGGQGGVANADGLGNTTAAIGNAAASGNIFVNQINGANPALQLIGGGGAAGTTTISILPYGLGDATAAGFNGFALGTGFVTIDNTAVSTPVSGTPNSVRLLKAAEYGVIGGNGGLDNANGVTTALAVPTTTNSVFFRTLNAQTISGSALTITSGALASNQVSSTISAPVLFGAAGAGEGVVSVIGALGSANTMTLSGQLTGTTLTKTGHGTLVLSNPAATNAFSSNLITVNAGFLSIANLGQLGISNVAVANPSSLVFNMHTFSTSSTGGGLLYTGAGPETSNIPMVVNSGHARIQQTAVGSLTWNGVISGAGGIDVIGSVASTFTLGGANTFSGGMRIAGTANTLQFTNDGNLGAATGGITVGSSGTVKLLGDWTTARNIAFQGGLGAAATVGFDTNGHNSSWSGPIIGGGAAISIFKGDSAAVPGVWSITGAGNSYIGNINIGTDTVKGGTVALTGAGELNSASIVFGTTTGAGQAGTYLLDISGATGPGAGTPWRSFAQINTAATTFAQAHQIQLGLNAGAPVDIRIGAGTFGTATANGTIQGFGKLVKTGTGTLTLATPNTFTGNVEIWGGTLSTSLDNQLGNAANNVALMGGTLGYTGAAPIATARNISLIPQFAAAQFSSTASVYANIISQADSGGVTINGNITDAYTATVGGITVGGGWEKQGANQLTLTGINSYTGHTRINAGTLTISNDNQLGGAASSIVMNGGTLQVAAGAAVVTGRNVYIPAASTLDVGAGGSIQFNGSFFGALTLTKTGAGTVTMNNDPLFFGTFNIGNGTNATGNVTLTAASTVFDRATVSLAAASAATLDMTNQTHSFGTVNTAVGTSVQLGASGSMITGFNNGAHTWAGNVLGGANASVVKVGTGLLTNTSNGNTFAGGFQVLAGGATFSGTGTLPLQSAFTIGAWGDAAALGTTFTLDNSGTSVPDRIANAQDIFINNSKFVFTTNAANTTEVINSLRGSGLSTVTMTTGGTLSFPDAVNGLTRVNNGTFLFRTGATSTLGSAAASATSANILFGNGPAGLGMVGTGLGPTKTAIIPYATGGDSAGSTGNLFVTYGANGIQTLQSPASYTTLAAATADDNVRHSPAALTTTVLGAGQTINSLIIAGASANFVRIDLGGFTLINESGAFLSTQNNVYASPNAFTGTVLGIHNGILQGGAAGTREIIFHTNAGDLNVGAQIATTGGLTKSGNSNLYLGNTANAYTGGTTVNGGNLVIDNLAAINDAAGNSLTLGGGFFKYRGGNATLASGSVVLAGGSANNAGLGGGISVVSGTTLTLGAGVVSGNGGLNKDGTGALVLQGVNTFNGPVIINAGALAITQAGALGNNSRILFSGSTAIGTTGGQTLRFDAPMTVTQDIQTFSGNSGVGMGFDTNGNNVTLSGVISSPTSIRGVYKFGNGDLTLTAAETYTGATGVYGGRLILGGANGSILGSNGGSGFAATSSIVVNTGGTLVLDNFTGANNNNRLPDAFSVSIGGNAAATGGVALTGGGELLIRGNLTVPTSEVTNRFTFAAGTVTLENNGQNVMLTSGLVNRLNTGSIGLLRGNNLGSTPGPTTTNWFAVDMGGGSVQLGGAGGAAGTPFVNILPGFMGATSNTGVGTDLVTYSSAVGFRLLAASEYTSALTATNFDASRAPNAIANGASVAVPQTTWITSAKLTAGGSFDGGGTLNLMQGTILATGNSSINVPVLSSTGTASVNGGYLFLTPGAATNLTVNAAMNGTTFGNGNSVSKYGAGMLTMANGYYGAGGSFNIYQGTVQLSGAAGNIAPVNTVVGVAKGATLDLGGFDRMISGLNSPSGITPGSFGLNVVQDGTVSLGGNTLTLYEGTGAFTGNITGSGGITKSLFGQFSTTTFTQPQSYSGPTTIYGGTLQLAGAGTLNSSTINVLGGTLQFNNGNDQQAVGGYLANRLVNGAVVVNLAGVMNWTSNPDTPANYVIPTLNLVGGGLLGTTSTQLFAGANAPTTITFNNLNRNANKGTLVANAADATGSIGIGLPQSPAGNMRILIGMIDGAAPAAALVGGGGADGTTTVSIIPWATSFGNNSFLTYNATNGLRPLDTTLEYSSSIVAGPTVNVRTVAATALVGPTTVNSLFQGTTSGNVTGNFDLTITSGALASNIAGTIGVNTNALLTGNGNTAELVVCNTAATTINYNITTAGGLTKYGGGVLTLAGANNTFGGTLTINEGTLAYTNDNQLGFTTGIPATSTPIALGCSVLASSNRGLQYTGPLAFVTLNRNITTNSHGQLTAPNNILYQINGNITGSGSLGFTGTIPIFELNGANTFTGDVLFQHGYVSIASDANLGNGGTLQMAGEGLVLRGPYVTSRAINSNGSWGFNTNGFDATLNGQLFGGSAMTKNGLGTATFTVPNAYTGTSVINGGAIRLVNNGAFNAGVTLNACTKLILDDTGTHFSDRIPDGSNITNTSGDLRLLGNAAVTTEEIVSGLTLNLAAKVTVVPDPASAAILRLGATGVLSRGAGSSVLFRGTNLGVNAPGTAGSANIMLFNPILSAAAFTGGGGPAGNTAISVIAGAFGDTNANGNGTQLVTYDLNKGIRLLTSGEYANALNDGTVMQDNIHLTAANTAIANAATINALWLENGASTSGAGIVTITAGNILSTGAATNVINGIITTGGANAIAIGGPGNLTINSIIPATSTGGLIKTGDGTLTLNNANAYTGNTTLASGTVVVGNNSAFGAVAGTVRLLGATLQAGTPGLAIANPIAISCDTTFSGGNDLTLSGTVSLENSQQAINVGAGRTLTLSNTVSANSTAVAGIGLTTNGTGLLVLTGNNTYGGIGGTTPASTGYYLSQTRVNSGELRVNGQVGTNSGTGGSTVNVAAAGTISGNGQIIPGQYSKARNTVSVAGTMAPGLPTTTAAPGILTIGNAATPGITDATVSLTGNFAFYLNSNQAITAAAMDTGTSGGVIGTGNNKLTVNGDLNAAGLQNIIINGNYVTQLGLNPASSYSFTVATTTGTNAAVNIVNQAQFNTAGFAGFPFAAYMFSFDNVGSTVYLNFTPVPEPATVLGICAAGAGVFGLIRRRLKKGQTELAA